jgi:uncharacterized membrane protein
MLIFSLFYGLYVGLPFLAPILMKIGWESPARIIYTFYSLLCHQMAQRSFFLFGTKTMYSMSEIQAVWPHNFDIFLLRRFIGTSELGWKVAWSDRMVSMYTSILLFGWIWYPLRRRVKLLPLWGFFLIILPMALDGISHVISDFAGIGQGFRYPNEWLAILTDNTFALSFYAGDALGSFNFWMRLLSGSLFGLGFVWLGFPYLDEATTETMNALKPKFQHTGDNTA